MEDKELKLKISKKFEKADPDLLKMMLEFIEKYDASKPAAYKADGYPVSYTEYLEDLQESINQVAEEKLFHKRTWKMNG
jgi:predicted acetyltransferase